MFDNDQYNDPGEFNDGDPHQYSDQTAKNVADSVKNKTAQGFKSLGRGLANKTKSAVKRAGKKVVTDVAANGLKLMLKKYLLIAGLFLVGLFLVIVLLMAFANFLFGERGNTQDYSYQSTEANVSGYDEDGRRQVIALTEPQALKISYYRLLSCASYTKTYDGETIYFYNPEEGDKDTSENMKEDFATLQDYYENERYFLLSDNFLLMADEEIHVHGVYYPEQLIKPVFAKENPDTGAMETQTFWKEGTSELRDDVLSTAYKQDENGDYKKDESADKVSGIWDYGFGSIVEYTPGEKNVWLEGTILTEDQLDPITNEEGEIIGYEIVRDVPVNRPFKIENVPLQGEKDKLIGGHYFHDDKLNAAFGNDTTTYPIKIPLISSAALFSGNVTYKYEDKVTEIPFSQGTGSSETDGLTKVQYSSYNGVPLYRVREGSTYTKMPEKVGEEKDVIGFDYIDQYFKEYTNYVPLGLKNDLNFETRAEVTYDMLIELGLLKPYTGEAGSIIIAPVVSLDGTDGQLNDGSNGGTGDWNNWNDLTKLAHLIAAEAGNSDPVTNKMDELMVGSVAMNRVASDLFPDTLMEVIAQPGQYACFNTTDGGHFASFTPTDSDIASAKRVMTGSFPVPANIIFQSQSVQGPLFAQVGVHAYCYGKQDSGADVHDRYGKTALSPDELRGLAEDYVNDTAESAGATEEEVNAGIGEQSQIEVTYYCEACNDGGTDAVAWADGTGAGHAIAGVTCAMSEGSREALGMQYGDWIYLEGIGKRRLEDLCGTGLGTSNKSDRIVVDVYVGTGPGGVCQCDELGTKTVSGYKLNGSGDTAPSSPGGFYDKTSGIYHVDMNNPSGFDLFQAGAFDSLSATSAYEQFRDPNRGFLEKMFSRWGETFGEFLNDMAQAFEDWGVMKGLNAMYNEEALFTEEHFPVDTALDTGMARHTVYQAIALNKNLTYDEVAAQFDENSMDLLFVGNVAPGGLFGSNFTLVNGVGTTVDGFISPTDCYYQPTTTYSSDAPYVTLATPAGTPIKAVYDGTVSSVNAEAGTVVITHSVGSDTYVITFGNISPSVSSGATVTTGQIVGSSRDGGYTLKVELNGSTVDPMSIFYRPSMGVGGNAVAQIAMNELTLHEADPDPGAKYQDYWKFDHSAAWCAMFASYCYKEAGYIDAGIYPATNNASCSAIKSWFEARGGWVPAGSGYVPQTGDAVLMNTSSSGGISHIGICIYAEMKDGQLLVHTIEGNTSNKDYSGGGEGNSDRLNEKTRKETGANGTGRIVGYCVPSMVTP